LLWAQSLVMDVGMLLDMRAQYSKTKWIVWEVIALFRSITMLCGTNNILQNIPTSNPDMENIPQNNVNPTKHWYGSE
jgi:hypothetical protein